MYTNSNGVKIKVETLETSHLINALAKKMRELFLVIDETEYNNQIEEIEALINEYYVRTNKFLEKRIEEEWI